jgi:3-oxoacyl-[acyl-carrier protein] reductase
MAQAEPSSRRIAIVTGASSGLGLAIAKRLHLDGFHVAMVARDAARLRQAAADVGDAVETHDADLGDAGAADHVIDAIVTRHRRIDVLINNAGIMERLLLDTPRADADRIWDDMIRVNLTGLYRITRAAAAHLASPGGRIVNLGSIVGDTGGSTPGFLAYAASKAGVNGLTFALARELAPRGITVNAVAPGSIGDTGQTGTFTAEQAERIRAMVPLGRPGNPRDIAATVAWLVSEGGDYVTGAIIPVNGGWRFG